MFDACVFVVERVVSSVESYRESGGCCHLEHTRAHRKVRLETQPASPLDIQNDSRRVRPSTFFMVVG